MLKKVYCPLQLQARKSIATAAATAESPKQKVKVELDEEVNKLILEDKLKPRKHPGTIHKATIHLPEWLQRAVKQLVKAHPIPLINDEIIRLIRYLHSRQPPVEDAAVQAKYAAIRDTLKNKIDFKKIKSPENVSAVEAKLEKVTKKVLHQSIYNWAPIEYTYNRSLLYLLARGGHDYTVLYTIFSEIQKRDPQFRPQTLFDFGSGVGSVSWAASEYWSKSLVEYLGIEISEPMMKIAQNLQNMSNVKIKNFLFKQYFPVASPSYDLIVSAFSLLELPNRKSRIETILNLWKKTNKYLVIVEEGTNAGFGLINEARSFFLQILKSHNEKEFYKAFIFAPCPHHLSCPRFSFDDTPCNFQASFFPLPSWKKRSVVTTQYSYIILKKGSDKEEKDNWPRIVRSVKTRSNFAMCRMCTKEGNLQDLIFTKSKHERPLYRCARSSVWGARLPIKIFNNGEASETSEELEINNQVFDDDYEELKDDK